MTTEEARSKLALARSHLVRIQEAIRDKPDYVEAITWAFYAYEALSSPLPNTKGYVGKRRTYRRRRLLKNCAG